MNFIKIKLLIDEYLNQAGNFLLTTRTYFNNNFYKKNLKRNIFFKNLKKGEEAIIIANGPSLNDFDLLKLKDKNLIFMNRGFMHNDYETLKPEFHFIIDDKLNNGIWPLSFIDSIFKKNPNVILFLNAKWHKNQEIVSYEEKYTNQIYWIDTRLFFTKFFKSRKIDLTRLTFGNAVVGSIFSSLVYMGVNKIYFLGQDFNGLCYELINKNSHFYGNNYENYDKDHTQIYEDLFSMSVSLRNWINIKNFASHNNLKLYNLSRKGIFHMIPYKNINDIINES